MSFNVKSQTGIQQGYLVNLAPHNRPPAQIEIIDPVGRLVYNQPWPTSQDRLALPALHGVLLLRLSYAGGRQVVLRHGFLD